MNEITLRTSKKAYHYKIASCWNELSKKQLLKFCLYGLSQENEETARLLLLYNAFDIPARLLSRLSDVQKAQLSRLLTYLYEQLDLTENKLLYLKAIDIILYGPEDSFRNLRWNEFMVAEKYADAYRNSQDPAMLQYLSAVLYRPKRRGYDPTAADYQGDIREDFNQFLLEHRVLLVRSWKPEIHLAIYFYYLGCRKELQQDYPHVFGHDAERPEHGSEGEAPADFDWLDFLRHLPADKFGTLEEIEKQHVHSVLYLSDRMMKEAKKQKQK